MGQGGIIYDSEIQAGEGRVCRRTKDTSNIRISTRELKVMQ